ncbi:MAG: hypothetical protein LBF51_08330 [Zoogloeaceae bacterium]|jgi:hypothetical protein|nr:hypothetical protein [Zoogloeaceae bacterium]
MDDRTRQRALAIIHAVLAILARLQAYFDAMDAGTFREEDHPRNKDGKFGAGGESNKESMKPRGIARDKPPVVSLKGDELGQKEGESLKDAARRYYENDLMKHPANREGFGEVKFYKGSGWSKFESTTQSDPEQLKLLPAVKPVIEKGEYLGKATPDDKTSEKKKNISAYHYFEANVGMPDGKKYVGVTVIEDHEGNKFYNLTQDPDEIYARKQRRSAKATPDFKTRDNGASGDAFDILDLIIA